MRKFIQKIQLGRNSPLISDLRWYTPWLCLVCSVRITKIKNEAPTKKKKNTKRHVMFVNRYLSYMWVSKNWREVHPHA